MFPMLLFDRVMSTCLSTTPMAFHQQNASLVSCRRRGPSAHSTSTHKFLILRRVNLKFRPRLWLVASGFMFGQQLRSNSSDTLIELFMRRPLQSVSLLSLRLHQITLSLFLYRISAFVEKKINYGSIFFVEWVTKREHIIVCVNDFDGKIMW